MLIELADLDAFGVGGFASEAVIFFRDDWAFSDFLVDGSDVAAEARAAAGQDRTQAGLHFVNGRAVFAPLGLDDWMPTLTLKPPAVAPPREPIVSMDVEPDP